MGTLVPALADSAADVRAGEAVAELASAEIALLWALLLLRYFRSR